MARREFLSYCLSLMRAHNAEHRDSLPVLDVSALRHVAYVFDALVYYMRSPLSEPMSSRGETQKESSNYSSWNDQVCIELCFPCNQRVFNTDYDISHYRMKMIMTREKNIVLQFPLRWRQIPLIILIYFRFLVADQEIIVTVHQKEESIPFYKDQTPPYVLVALPLIPLILS